MLEQVDLAQSLSKSDYKIALEKVQTKLFFIQMDAVKAGLPIMIVFEGWEAAGKGSVINTLIEKLDPRGFEVYSTHEPNQEELYRPFMWRFWLRIPAQGECKIFDQSWYRRVLTERVEKEVKKKVWQNAFTEMRQFERQQVHNGTLLIKFWLHISEKEQKKRFQEMEKDPLLSWKITDKEWKLHKKYKKYYQVVEEMLEKSSTYFAPWYIIPCEDLRYGKLNVLQVIYEQIADALERRGVALTPIPLEVVQAQESVSPKVISSSNQKEDQKEHKNTEKKSAKSEALQ